MTTRISGYLQLVEAPNPGPMTLDGTNTWVIGDPDMAPPVVVDPGPLDDQHLDAVMAACHGRVSAILLTHRHVDHSEAASSLAERAGCGVRAADPDLQVGSAGLAAGESIEVAGAQVRVLATPGHTSDSISLLLTGDDSAVRLVTGDMVLGRGTTVITHPDGNLRSYLASLGMLEALVRTAGVSAILPGHGPVVTKPEAWLTFYREHRLMRLQQVRDALAAGDRTPSEVVARVYADVPQAVWPAAEQSVAAQLNFLASKDASLAAQSST